jgi:prenyltransferase beta subunit
MSAAQLRRREFMLRSLVALAGVAAAPFDRQLAEQEDPPQDSNNAKSMITAATQRAIDEGLAYLAKHQHRDGSFGSMQYHGNVAITSLGALAMMAGGHQPERGIYGDVVTRALRYVLEQDDGQGYLNSRTGVSHGPMYGHGFGTLFLAEVHGMVHDRQLRDRLHDTLKRAVKLIVDYQNREGGWRYKPGDSDADISVTICQIMALRAARNAGYYVPKSTADRCIAYVKRCQDKDGGFRYQQQSGISQFARSAAGVVALQCAGVYKGPEIDSALQYLMQFKPSGGFIRPDVHLHYFYGHYYAAQAMWTAGESYWKEWYPAIRDELLNHPDQQRQLGCWTDIRFSNDYATAMACIILQIPNNYLPILQK